MFSLDPYIIVQILFMVVSIRRRLMIILIVWLLRRGHQNSLLTDPAYNRKTQVESISDSFRGSKTHAPRKMICCSLTCIVSIFCNTVFIPRLSLSTLYLYLSPCSCMYADKFEYFRKKNGNGSGLCHARGPARLM